MPPYVFARLTMRNDSDDTIRRALMWDTVKWNLKLTKLTEKTLPGFYMYKGELYEVFYEISTTSGTTEQARHVPASHRARSQPLVTGRGERRDQHFSASDPVLLPLNPPSAHLANHPEARLRLRKVTQADALPFIFTMDMSFGSRSPENTIAWEFIPGTTTPLKLRVMIDVGGNGHLWTYSTESTVYGITSNGAKVALTNDQRMALAAKNKVRYVKHGNSTVRLGYMSGKYSIDVQVTTAPIIAIWSSSNERFNFPYYKFGAAIGFTPAILGQPFDGICGLGRSHSAPTNIAGVSIVQHMFKTNTIQEEQFYVCCRYMPDMAFGHGFVIFGSWPPIFNFVPDWKTVYVPANAAPAKWEVDLVHIHILAPGLEAKKFGLDCRVLVDNGTTRSMFDKDIVQEMNTGLKEIWEAAGLQSFDVPENVEVELAFKNTSPGILRRATETVAVRGRARNFFVIPNEHSNTAPRVLAISEATGTRYILGINFFRTFLLGFQDTSHRPAIQIAIQP